MQYNGIELKKITEPQVFDPPKKMVVWDNDANKKECIVAAILTGVGFPVTTIDEYGRLENNYLYCAEIPEEPNPKPEPRMVTNRELAKWLIKGNGEMTFKSKSESDIDHLVFSSHLYEEELADEECDKALKRADDGSWIVVRKWDDTEWHEPTADYLGLE